MYFKGPRPANNIGKFKPKVSSFNGNNNFKVSPSRPQPPKPSFSNIPKPPPPPSLGRPSTFSNSERIQKPRFVNNKTFKTERNDQDTRKEPRPKPSSSTFKTSKLFDGDLKEIQEIES